MLHHLHRAWPAVLIDNCQAAPRGDVDDRAIMLHQEDENYHALSLLTRGKLPMASTRSSRILNVFADDLAI